MLVRSLPFKSLAKCTYANLSRFSTIAATWQEKQQFSSQQQKQEQQKSKVLELDSLENILIESIKTTGPIPVSSYMKQCLTNPEHGYYTTRDPLGSSGDFITSPEISSVFGETIGIWLYATWLLQQKPKNVQFIEFGPGRGTLMNDAVRVFNRLNKDEINLRIVMIEQSPQLREEQFKLLCDDSKHFLMKREEDGMYESVSRWGNEIEWLETEEDVINHENFANFIIAHEFFDALPVQQFQKTSEGWREYLVDYAQDPVKAEDKSTAILEPAPSTQTKFHLVLSPHETPSSLIPASAARFKDLPEGSRIEICPESYLYASKMSQIINSNKQAMNDPLKKGGILICDYGPSESIPENTLRGIKNHKIVSPFSDPGEVDLSVDVDFSNLSKIFTENGCISYGPVEQGDWLHELGIGFRVDQALDSIKDEDKRQKLIESYKRLVDPDQMGKAYKFLGVLPGGSQGVFPVGFGGGVVEP